MKKVRWTFFPPNRPTSRHAGSEIEPLGSWHASACHKEKTDAYASAFSFKVCGKWGEAEYEKGPVDLFPAEPTDEPACRLGD